MIATKTSSIEKILSEIVAVEDTQEAKAIKHKIVRLLRENKISGTITLADLNKFLAHYKIDNEVSAAIVNRVKIFNFTEEVI